MIYTSYYSNLRYSVLDNFIPISIAGKCPDWYEEREMKQLAPKWWFFKKYKDKEITSDDYIKHYIQEVLLPLDEDFLAGFHKMYEHKRNFVLLCYEKPEDFCHRHVISYYFNHNYNWSIKEYGKDVII